MSIKEYIKIQSDICENIIMKNLFLKLKNKFYPIVYENNYDDNYKIDVDKKINSNNAFNKRKVRVYLDNNKTSLGLIDSDGYDIKIVNNEKLEFQMICEGISYYYNKTMERMFYRETNSRLIHVINKDNYKEHKSNINFIKDYCFNDGEMVKVL